MNYCKHRSDAGSTHTHTHKVILKKEKRDKKASPYYLVRKLNGIGPAFLGLQRPKQEYHKCRGRPPPNVRKKIE